MIGRRPAPPARPPQQRWRHTEAGRHVVASRHWDDRLPESDHPQLVLVHGLVGSGYFVPLAQRLANRWRVHAPDLPGFGRSQQPPKALDTRQLGLALARWMDAVRLREATVVANSYGCQIVAEALLGRPDLASRLVLLAPTIDRRARRVSEQLRRWRMEQRTQSRALKRLLVREYRRAGLTRTVATFRHALTDTIEDKLPFLDQPALVVRGTRDPLVSQAWAEEVTELLPRGRLVLLPGATHAVNHEQPLQTARVIAPFLRHPI